MIVAEFSCLIGGPDSRRRIQNVVQKFTNSSKGVTIELAATKHISNAEQTARPKTPTGSANGADMEPLDHHVPSSKARTCCGLLWWPFRAQFKPSDLELGQQSPHNVSTSNVINVRLARSEDISTNFNVM